MRERGIVGAVFAVVAGLGIAFLLIPILMIFPLSIDPGPFLSFPPTGFSLRWFEQYLTSSAWLQSTLLSLQIAAEAAAVATVLGTAAAIGLARSRLPGRELLAILLTTPVLLPTIVIAVAIYGVYARLGLVGTSSGIALAHAVLGVPFVLLNVRAALGRVPRSYDEAAMSLGATPLAALFLVTLPLIWRGIAAGAVFAFVISFDEVVIAMFLSSNTSATLPKRMIDGIFFDLTPVLAAVSALLVVFNVALALAGLALLRVRRGAPPTDPAAAL